MSEGQHLDGDALRELQAVMGDEFGLLVRTFATDSAQRVDAVRAAAAAGDADALRRAAHSFKGSAGNMGALRLAELCRLIEDAARDGNIAAAQGPLDELAAEFASAQAELDALVG